MIDTTILTAGLDALIAQSPQAAALGMYAANVQIAQIARSLVRVRTGYTKSTIRIEDTSLLESEVIADGAALFLELGWHAANGRPVGPFPFLRPAFDAVWPQVPSLIGGYLMLAMTGQPLPGKAAAGT